MAPSAPIDECEPLLDAAVDGVAVTAALADAAAAAGAGLLLPSLPLLAAVGCVGVLAVRSCAASVGIGPH